MRTLLLLGVLGAFYQGFAWAGSDFDFKVDRFEVDRSVGGAFVDDFDADTGWWHYFGTAMMIDGTLHLTNPGTLLPNGLGVLPGTALNISAVLWFTELPDQGASFTARSYWQPVPLVFGDFNHMSLVGQSNSTAQVLGLALTNPTPPGEPVRYQLDQHVVYAGSSGGSEYANVPIDPASITGDVVFSLAFDARSRMVTTTFSLDGGQTFQAPFAPKQLGIDSVRVMLGADPLPDAVRPAVPLCVGGTAITDGSVLVKRHGKGSLVFGASLPTWRFINNLSSPWGGMQLRLADAVSGAAVLDWTGTHAIPGTAARCSRRDGWRGIRGGYRYSNASGAFPPTCTPGSAAGLRRVDLRAVRKTGTTHVTVVVRPAPAVVPSDLAATLTLGTASIVSSTGRCGTGALHCSTARTSTSCR